MVIKKIVFLTESKFNKRDFNRFGVNILKRKGFDIEVWDVSKIFNRRVAKIYSPPDFFSFSGLKAFEWEKELNKAILNLDKRDLIVLFDIYGTRDLRFHKVISKSRANYAVFMGEAMPYFRELKFVQRFRAYFLKVLKLGFFNSIRLLNNRFKSFKIKDIKPAKFVFAGGRKSLRKNHLVSGETKIIWAHSLDYDLYLKDKKNKMKERNIAVFLDEYMPFHPINITWGYKNGIVNPNEYFSNLNKFFDKVEKETGLKVVIAAHPRSDYEKHNNFFGKRKWYRGKTMELVKNSKLVIAHSSTSLSYACIFKKPIVIITDSILDRSPPECTYIEAKAIEFGKRKIFVNDLKNLRKIDWKQEMKINEQRYKDYMENYIKLSGSPEKSFWEIVAEEIKLMEKE